MIHVANKKVISNISKKSLRANKMRNIFAVVAIALTTILFTSFFTIGMSMLKSMEQSTMRQVGSSAHGSFKYMTYDELQKIKNHKLIKEIGYSIFAAFPENKELKTRPTEMRYATDKQAEFFFSTPTTGKMPQKENEIAVDTLVLDKLGTPHKLGEKVTLEYTIEDKKQTKDFILCGFWNGDKAVPASMTYVSHGFIEANLAGIDPKYNKSQYQLTGLVFADVMFDNSINIEGKLKKILNDNGYTEKEIPIGVNWAYASTKLSFDFGTIAALTGGIFLIIFTGYLIIYNIFYISIAKDTKHYGMLKTIGTTAKQIKSIVRKQAFYLSSIGIPFGLIIGYVIGAVLVPFVMQSSNVTSAEVSLSPVIFIGAALFSLITVFISCRRPAKVASSISPIEALRYTDASQTNRRSTKRSLDGAKIYKMACSNVFRNRKKAVIVMISLSLSIILLNVFYTIVTGFDMEKFLSGEILRDFQIADVAYFNPYMGYIDQNTVTEDIVKEFSSQDGVEGLGRVYFNEYNHKLSDKAKKWFESSVNFNEKHVDKEYLQSLLQKGEIPSHLYGIDEFVWDTLNINVGKFDGDKFASGKYAVISIPQFWSDEKNLQSYYNIGETITVSYGNGTQKNYEVMAIGYMPGSIDVRHNHMYDMDIYLPSEEYKANIKKPVIMTAVFNVEDNYIDSFEKYIADYTKNKENMLGYMSRNTMAKEFEKVKSTYTTVGYSLSFIIALIGILNFINSMVTSIISRKKEFAMLQSIAMTGKQLYRLLIFEGLYYGLFTIGIVSTIGILFTYLGVQAIAGTIWFFSYHFTVIPILISMPFLIIFSFIIPALCYMPNSKISIVERLRDAE